MDYSANYSLLIADGSFKQRVEAAAVQKAKAISAEAETGLKLSVRKELARRVLQDSSSYADLLVRAVARDSTIAALSISDQSEVTDAQIDGALSDAAWNSVAGAYF